jgi:cellulose synthase/poly-beta-1,6-N-acetylglucosamine synthase-like glycosyltransferase
MNWIELAINAVGIVFGVFWIWINVYIHYPLARATVKRVLQRGSITSHERPDDLSGRDDAPQDELTDGGVDLPPKRRLTVDVLLPAYKESEIVENSIASVRDADYDQELIHLVVLTEPDDEETRAALEGLADEYEFEEMRVPPEYPGDQNKPRALNYGSEHTDGDLVTVIDAENVFHPAVFERANERFLATDADFLQARLDMVNEEDGWLNTLFRAEYGYWYNLVLPPFFDVDYPIPMGGTSCFFRRSVLEEVSSHRRETYGGPWTDEERRWVREQGFDAAVPWDPENVTEDFELGLFLWQNGYEAGFLDLPKTDEESPLGLDSWMGQRTRWQKGKVYTFLEYLREPPETARERLHLYSQTAVPHLGPINVVAVFLLFFVANLAGYAQYPAVRGLLLLGLSWAGVSLILYAAGYWTASDSPVLTRLRRTVVVFLTLPFYWLLQWIADLRAFARTRRGDFHWVKTTHAGRNVLSQATAPAGHRSPGENQTQTLPMALRVPALLAIVGVAAGARLYNLAGWSLYGDELFTIAMRADRAPMELLFVSNDTHPPLHYLMVHYWMKLFGDSTVSVRLLSVIFSVGTVVAVYYLAAELYDDRAGLAAALVTALSVYQVHYGQAARMYSLLAFFTALSWYGFARIESAPRRGSLVYVPATVLLVYTHLFAMFVVVAQNAYMVLSGRTGGVSWRRWIGLEAIVGLCSIPWITFLLSTLLDSDQSTAELIDWLDPPTLYNLLDLFLRFVGHAINYPLVREIEFSYQLASVMLIVYAVLGVFAVVQYRSDGTFELTDIDSTGQMLLLITVPIVLPFVLSYLLFPVFFYRYAVPASVGLYVLVGKGIANLDRRWLTVAVVAMVVVASGGMLADHYTNGSEEKWEEGIACLDAETESGDIVLAQPAWMSERFEYFDETSDLQTHYVPKQTAMTDQDVEEIKTQTAGQDRVWVFLYTIDEDIGHDRLLGTLEETHEKVTLIDSAAVEIYRFDRPSATEGTTGTSTSHGSGACPSAERAATVNDGPRVSGTPSDE